MRWVYPLPSHPRRQWLWRKFHPRRVQRFNDAIDAQLQPTFEAMKREMDRVMWGEPGD